jgi:hypothetical protein
LYGRQAADHVNLARINGAFRDIPFIQSATSNRHSARPDRKGHGGIRVKSRIFPGNSLLSTIALRASE